MYKFIEQSILMLNKSRNTLRVTRAVKNMYQSVREQNKHYMRWKWKIQKETTACGPIQSDRLYRDDLRPKRPEKKI